MPLQFSIPHTSPRMPEPPGCVFGQLEPSPVAMSAVLVALGFGKEFGILHADLGRVRISDRTQPACKRRVHETVCPAVAALRQVAALPHLHVHSPSFSPFRILKIFCSAGEPHERRNPIGTMMRSSKVVQDSDAYRGTAGLRPVISVLRVLPTKSNCPVRLLLGSLRRSSSTGGERWNCSRAWTGADGDLRGRRQGRSADADRGRERLRRS
jgi:hypothetical protein